VLRRFAISFLLIAMGVCAGARTRPHYGGTLRVEIAGDGFTSPDATIVRLLLDGLTQVNSDGTIEPALSVSWKSSSNDHRWEFPLRPGVRFHNGDDLTAARVVASLNLACNGSCPWSAVHAVGSSVVFTGDSPMPNLPWLLAGRQFLISQTDANDSKWPPYSIGTGPFQLSGQARPQFVLTANENYWGGRPFADKIEILTNRSVRDQWLDLSVDRADVVEVPAQQLRQAQQQHLNLVVSPPVELLALQAVTSGALVNPVLRASIAQAVDRGALSNVIFQKQGQVTASLLPQSLTGYAFLFSTDRDLRKAIELRGGLTPPPLVLAAENDATMQLAAQRLALNLHDAGFTVQVVTPRNAARADLLLRRLPLTASTTAAALEILLRAAGENSSVTAQDPQALYRFERDDLDRNTLVPLLLLPRAYAAGGRVRNLAARADGALDLADASLEDAP